MKKSQSEPTNAQNLEEKFDRGEDVLDYFDASKARVIQAETKSEVKAKSEYEPKRNLHRRAVVREKSPPYGKKAR
jgi:hypothetical protein